MDSKIKRTRNIDYKPCISDEGFFSQLLPTPPGLCESKFWFDGLTPHDRMFYHQTLNSSRRFAGFHSSPTKIPQDSLDFMLASQYEHQAELFLEKCDIPLQHETVDNFVHGGKRKPFRRLRNTRDLSPERVIAIGHPLRIGGIKAKLSTHSVKLMCSGHHTSFTNPGYSRQPGDGNVFNY